MDGQIRIGTCSWKYPSWADLVYSSAEPEDYLAEYARKYDSVEVDQWFWSLGKPSAAGTMKAALPRKGAAEGYAASVPANFRFTVKCPNALTLTHAYAKKGEPLVANPRFLDIDFFMEFLSALGGMIPKIGLFIFQFEYLNKEKMAGPGVFRERLGSFLDALPRGFPYAVEIRNPRWMDASWFEFLRGRSAAPVLLQGYWMDDVCAVAERAGESVGDTVCIRLHGEDREGMEERTGEDWSRIVRPKDDELGRVGATLRQLRTWGKAVWLNVNNHYEGSAPLTIEKIKHALRNAEADRDGKSVDRPENRD
jgi:uncharacterized protein YecE (DUF72 family)